MTTAQRLAAGPASWHLPLPVPSASEVKYASCRWAASQEEAEILTMRVPGRPGMSVGTPNMRSGIHCD